MNNINNFKSLIENLPCGVFRSTIGFNPRFVYFNSRFRQLLGLEEKEILNLSVVDIFEDRHKYKDFVKIISDGGKCRDFNAAIGGRAGIFTNCLLSGVAIKDEKGKVKHIDVSVEDISQIYRNEKDLNESKGLFQTVFNNTTAAITVTDKNEKIVAWNPSAERLLQMKQEDLFNKPVKDLYPKGEWLKLRSLNVRKKGVLSSIETKMFRKDNSIIDVDVSISVLKDSDGNIMGSIGIIRDITKQKEAENKIKESENKIRVILDNSAASIIMTDSEERIVSWNKFTETLLGYKQNQLHLKPVSFIYPPEEWQKIRSERIREKGLKHHLETKICREDGKIIDVDISINILRDINNNIVGSVGIMQDITEQKQLREMLIQAKLAAEQANSAKSLFLANMSHEVRTPMNTIMGMLDLTLDLELGKEQKENIVIAKEAADNLLNLINDILDLSRVEAGKITLENIDFHLPNILSNVCKGLQVIAQKKSLNVVLEIAENVPHLVMGDPVRIRQILINLINNAIKFTDQGKNITVKVFVVSQQKDKVLLQFSVIDQGIGIPKDKQGLIFEAFTQAETSTNRKYGGTGLGLTISKRLSEMMGGRIWVESEVDKGSTFSFTAQLKVVKQKADDSSAQKETISCGANQEELKGVKVLLAEDNLVNQRMAAKMLEKIGCVVDSVDNGERAIRLLGEKHFDIILMDAHMPVLDGHDATKKIREEERGTGRHIPIIALTASAMEEDKKKCFNSGMDGYVSKPIDRNKLFGEIKKFIKKGKK